VSCCGTSRACKSVEAFFSQFHCWAEGRAFLSCFIQQETATPISRLSPCDKVGFRSKKRTKGQRRAGTKGERMIGMEANMTTMHDTGNHSFHSTLCYREDTITLL
jgi:hypothetical protein